MANVIPNCSTLIRYYFQSNYVEKSWLSVSDLDITQRPSSLLLEWKSPVCLINSSTILTIISNDTVEKEIVLNITIESSCSNKRGRSSIQLNRNSLSLICTDGRITQLPQPLILKPCFKYAATMIPYSAVTRKSVESKPSFFIANLIFEGIALIFYFIRRTLYIFCIL